MRYYIIAGEASGDLHGKNLITALKEQDPTAEFRFWGGDKMAAAAGVTPVMHYSETSIMGYTAVLRNMKKILGFFKLCKADITQWKPDCVVFIDYPGFNLKIAKWAHTAGFRTYYYIAPKVWAWKEGRVKKLRAYVDKLFVIFPFEVEWFAARGIEASYVGNPLLDEIAERPAVNKPTRPIIALVAGSRRMEIEHNLWVMVDVMRNFPEYEGVVTGVNWLPKSLYEKYTANSANVRVVYDQTYQTLAAASGALVTSGTATLEAAILGVPEAVCYRGPAISMAIARVLIGSRIKWISLVNLVMNRTVVSELIGNKCFTVQTATAELHRILPGGERNASLKEDYAELRRVMGEAGASARCAKEIYELIK